MSLLCPVSPEPLIVRLAPLKFFAPKCLCPFPAGGDGAAYRISPTGLRRSHPEYRVRRAEVSHKPHSRRMLLNGALEACRSPLHGARARVLLRHSFWLAHYLCTRTIRQAMDCQRLLQDKFRVLCAAGFLNPYYCSLLLRRRLPRTLQHPRCFAHTWRQLCAYS